MTHGLSEMKSPAVITLREGLHYSCPNCDSDVIVLSKYCSHCGIEVVWKVETEDENET